MNIEVLLKEMTLDEKIGQMQQLFVNEDNVDEVIEEIRAGRAGSCILALNEVAGNTDDFGTYKAVSGKVMEASKNDTRLKIPVIIGRDVIHGEKTIFPIPLAQAATWDMELIKEGARRMMAESYADGVNWTFAPMLDLIRDPRWGRVIESYGEDPYLGAKIGKASVEGAQSSGKIAACAKHFVGYGAAEGGRDYTKSEITDYTLRNMYLPAFKGAVDADVKTVMNSFSAIGGELSVASKYLFRDILRNEMGFDGFVISDWGSIEWQMLAKTCDTKEECAYNCINAGIDMEMVTTCYMDNLKELVEEGKISEELIDECVRNILKVKNDIGLFDDTEPLVPDNDNMEFAREFARNSMILMKNDNNLLPIKEEPKSILIIGPMANEQRALSGSWCAGGYFGRTPTLYEAVKERFRNSVVEYVDNLYEGGYHRAMSFDLVIMALGEWHYVTGERAGMANIEIADDQIALARKMRKLAKKMVTVVFAGRPLAMEELYNCTDALVYGWHSGMMAAPAFVDVLTGDFVPCGKAPMTFVRSTGQIPLYYNAPYQPIREKGKNTYYTTPTYAYNDECATPLFPFGFGMSYTTFNYDNLSCNCKKLTQQELKDDKKFKIKIDVENAGDYSANEVSQLYISACKAKKQRPIRELKGFKKTYIPKGEKVTLEFELGREELGYYPEKKFVVESVKFNVFVGRDCYADNKLSIEVVD